MAFNGTWMIDHNENYTSLMLKMGVNFVIRKLVEHDNLKLTIEQKGDKFTVTESSTFRTREIEFTLGVQFEYSMADGTELTGTWAMEGETLIGSFTRKDNGKLLTTKRSLVGGQLEQSYNYEGVNARRIFTKA